MNNKKGRVWLLFLLIGVIATMAYFILKPIMMWLDRKIGKAYERYKGEFEKDIKTGKKHGR